jgi:hypothetical protein
MLEAFMEICRENRDLVKIRQKCRALYLATEFVLLFLAAQIHNKIIVISDHQCNNAGETHC